ncbi:MAG: carbohydrate kinase family protein [Desulfobacteraceae bacterium]|nr:carbohydrate kinase family protein [Desulfobacteraceae bacterium]MBC2720642.1 carbohydrate kinase family protein [Desulfobacteraceae bacterium]
MKTTSKGTSPIITIGSGNVEHILKYDGEIRIGRKHIVTSYELFGGSCINYFLRLITAGIDVFPIPFIGKDQHGHDIRKHLVKIGLERDLNEKALQFISSKDFLFPNVQTPKAIIVVHQGQRTIFSQGLPIKKNIEEHFQNRLDFLCNLASNDTGSVMIGHISVDGDIHKPGVISKKTINTYFNKFFLFANFGNSQIKHGVDFWIKDLSHIDLFQLNLEEIKRFFNQSGRNSSLNEIIKFLRERSITAVITINRFGAIGTYKDGSDGIVLAWPLKIKQIIDPTGAGDAFASGMISSLNGNKYFTFKDFLSAIVEGRDWASYACTTIGASGNCPDKKTLDTFRKKYSNASHKLIEVIKPDYAKQIMELIDKVY